MFLHYPPITQDRICPEIYDVLVEYKIKRCFYGHLHSFATKSAFEGERDGIKFSLISGDHLEFLPKLIENSRNFCPSADFAAKTKKKSLFWQKI